MLSKAESSRLTRPVVYDYKSPVDFLRDLLIFNKATHKHYSIRRIVKGIEGCSPSLISQVLANKRRLTRDQLPAFMQIFKLNKLEVDFIDTQLNHKNTNIKIWQETKKKEEKNHILKDWVHLYIKDTCDLKGFKPEAQVIHRLISGIVPIQRIEKSIKFLLREGFWRIDINKKIRVDENALVTTNDIPDSRIRNFHKRALEIAKQGLDKYPVKDRYANTFLISVNRESHDELRLLIKKFHHELDAFIEAHPCGDEKLLQININLTPIGGNYNENS